MRVGKDTETRLGREGKLGRLAGRSQTFFPDKLAGMCSCASAVPLSQVEELASRGALGDIFYLTYAVTGFIPSFWNHERNLKQRL